MKVFVFPSDNKNNDEIKVISDNEVKNASFISLSCNSIELRTLLEGRVFNEIKPQELSNSKKKELLKDYVNLIGDIASYNREIREWWSSDISSKNRNLSPMQLILNDIVYSIQAINMCNQYSKDLYIFGTSYPVVEFIREYSSVKGVEIYIRNSFFLRLFSKYKYFFKRQIYLFKSVLSSLRNVFWSRHSFGKRLKINKNIPVILIKSFVFSNSFSKENIYKDPFFPGLEDYLRKKIHQNIQIVTISQGFSGRYGLYKNMRGIKGKTIMPAEVFISIKDIFSAGMALFKFWFFVSIKIPDNVNLLGYNISSTMIELVKSNGDSVPFGDYLYYYIGRNIAKDYNLQTCYITYEGNHWERMFVMGLKEVSPDIEIIGYQHAAVPQSAAGILISCKEVGMIPHPDRIITTGKQITEVLYKNSCFPKNRIQSGCALRYQYLYSLVQSPIRKISRNTYTILLVLGDLDSLSLLLYAIKEAKLLSDVNFIIRTHPILPLEEFFSICDMDYSDLPNNMSNSNIDYVQDDIERCDTVLYWSSTVALEALMMGKSLIYFDRGDVLSFDPMSLIDFDDLKWNVEENMPITGIIDDIINMDHEDLIIKVDKGRGCIMEYFAEQNEETMQAFLPVYNTPTN